MHSRAKAGLYSKAGGTTGAAGNRPIANSDAGRVSEKPGARILVVEDQEDVRRMVSTALEIEGYQVDEAGTAKDGLKRLGEREYELVLSDYAMPGGTGAWMIDEAARQGLMRRTRAMIITAHPDVQELADLTIIYKPIDLDYFLDQVRTLVGSPRALSQVPSEGGDRPYKVELVLYVSSTSSASNEARQNFQELLSRCPAGDVKSTVIDLQQQPLAGDADRIAFTPTLVKRYPSPRTWILGNLRRADILGDLLCVSGVDVAR